MGATYQIVVGNVGTVVTTSSHHEARHTYHHYVDLSKSGYGRVAGETVTWLKTFGDKTWLVEEHIGEIDR